MTSKSVDNITKIVGENTPQFITNAIIATIEKLENFRVNSFNSKYIFYPLLLILAFLLLRYIWRRVF